MQKLSKELNIHHHYCELAEADRERLGIKTIVDREKHWLGVLESVKQFPGYLMVCGATHVGSFSALLSASNYEPKLVESDYEKRLLATWLQPSGCTERPDRAAIPCRGSVAPRR